ncbi:hypothetical protein HBA92_04315 [Ochrobactrum sp. MR28]|nr:hypothetical protein [Ochrobactrum sp. MR28]MBX8816292.1 hypothetical protein [Ochrobactrum sp. MR31]
MWGALIGAGASLLGGLFGGGSKKQETTTTSHVDYKRMVREAEAAGFNPLTALRNGGAAGFSVSTGSTPATPLSARLADGVAGAANTFLANFDPFKDRQRENEFKLVEAQLANLNADTALKQRTGLGSVPTYTAGNTKRTMGASVGHNQKFKSVADALPASAGVSQTPEVERPKLTNPYPTSWGFEIDPDIPDASSHEERYGDSELGSMIAGALTFLGDQRYNTKQFVKREIKKFQDTKTRAVAKGHSLDGRSTTSRVIGDLWNNGFGGRKSPPLISTRRKKQ